MPRLTGQSPSASTPHPSRLIKFPSDSSPKFQRASLRSFSEEDEDLSLVDDLIQNKEKYKPCPGDSATIAMFAFSDVLRLNLERIQARVSYKPSRNAIVAACIRRVVVALRKDERISKLVDVRTRYKLVDSSIDSDVNAIIGSLCNSMVLTAPAGKRKNVNVPREYCGMISDLANDIGMSVGSLTVLSIMMVLAEQEEVVKSDAEDLYRCVRGFFRGIVARARACDVLLEAYGL